MNYRKIYFVGIKGVGMATLAVIAKEAGFVVGGSDTEEQFITDKILTEKGIYPVIGFKKENINKFLEGWRKEDILVITTAAHGGFDNPESVSALELGLRVITHGQAVGIFMDGEIFSRSGKVGISVSGAHGKTTTSAMIATYLTKLGFDPSYTIGTSEIKGLGIAGHYGQGNYFIAEADEYFSEIKYDRKPKFLYQRPKFLVITNIDFDHPDIYRDIEDIKEAYIQFIQESGASHIVVNGDSEVVKEVIRKAYTNNKTIITFGTSQENDYTICSYKQHGWETSFSIESKGIEVSKFSLSIPGYHNTKNAVAAIILLIELGVSIPRIRDITPEFKGTARRLEKVGNGKAGQIIFDDYAHHPVEIQITLQALNNAFPNKKIVCVFQPHTFSRTEKLKDDFAHSFNLCDQLILLPIFSSSRESGDIQSSSSDLYRRVKERKPSSIFLNDKKSVIEYIVQNCSSADTIIITMGAGDVYHIAYSLVNGY